MVAFHIRYMRELELRQAQRCLEKPLQCPEVRTAAEVEAPKRESRRFCCRGCIRTVDVAASVDGQMERSQPGEIVEQVGEHVFLRSLVGSGLHQIDAIHGGKWRKEGAQEWGVNRVGVTFNEEAHRPQMPKLGDQHG